MKIIKLIATSWQRRFWLEWRISQNSRAYNICCIYKLSGKLNRAALTKAFATYVHYYDPGLNSYFIEEKGSLYQIIAEDTNGFKQEIELKCGQKTSIRVFLDKITLPFNLENSPLVRIGLLETNENFFVLALVVTHIAIDGVTLKHLIETISSLYNHFLETDELPILPKPSVLGKYLKCQQNFKREFDIKIGLSYWTSYLRGATFNTPLHIYSGKSNCDRANQYLFKLGKALSWDINEFLSKNHFTAFQFYAAVYGVLLCKYFYLKNIVISYPVHLLSRGFWGLPGSYVNNCLLRVELDENIKFIELLNKIKNDRIDAKPHQNISLIDVIANLRQTLLSSDICAPNIILAERKSFEQDLISLNGIKASAVNNPFFELINDITLNFKNDNNGFAFRFDYRKCVFNKVEIKQFMKSFRILIKNCILKPFSAVTEINLLSNEEYRKILVDWNKTDTVFPREQTITQLFEKQVEETPNNVAIIFDDGKITYQQLNQKANQLARYIKSGYKEKFGHELVTETLIGICISRSVELVIGILGILKAGGAYLPFDSDYPENRKKQIILEASLSVILTQENNRQELDWLDMKKTLIIYLDKDWLSINQSSKMNLINSNNPTDLICVIYTSGSTGKPNGVMIEHKGVVRLVRNTNYISISPKDRIALASNISFDAMSIELWAALINGAALVVISQQIKWSIEKFILALNFFKVNILLLTARLFDFIAIENPGVFGNLKYLLVCGEALDSKTVASVMESATPPRFFINGYGPTESTTCATTYTIQSKDLINKSIPIGKPIANTKTFVLDQYLQPVPVGAIGELFISGDGLARGYLNNNSLTQKRFIFNQFISLDDNSIGNLRVYKTGDLVKLMLDGNIEFIGRDDEQVKIRGFRIELMDVSVNLELHNNIKQAVVLLKEANADKYLVAFYILKDSQISVNANELKVFLQSLLPDYMIPRLFINVNAIPLTVNGKLDKKALLSLLDGCLLHPVNGSIAEASQTQKIVISVFEELLEQKHTSPDINLFDLGAHSLLLIKACSILNKKLAKHILISDIFSNPTIAALVDFIDNEKNSSHCFAREYRVSEMRKNRFKKRR